MQHTSQSVIIHNLNFHILMDSEFTILFLFQVQQNCLSMALVVPPVATMLPMHAIEAQSLADPLRNPLRTQPHTKGSPQ